MLGRGAHGVVHLAKSHVDNNMYVLKEINVANLKEHRRRRVVSEVLLLRRLRHPNIIQYYTSFVDDGSLYIVMEYADAGDMYTALKARGKQGRTLPEDQVWDYFQQTAAGLQYLHHQNIIHRDVKSMNIFLMKDGGVKLGDLGVSRLMEDDGLAAEMSRVGTPMYFAPELVKREAYDQRVDVWSLGCLVYTIMQLEPPFRADNIYALAVDIVKKEPAPLPKMYSSALRRLVSLMLEKTQRKRPSVDKLISMFPLYVQQRMKEATAGYGGAVGGGAGGGGGSTRTNLFDNDQKKQEISISSTISTISLSTPVSTGVSSPTRRAQHAAAASSAWTTKAPQLQSSNMNNNRNTRNGGNSSNSSRYNKYTSRSNYDAKRANISSKSSNKINREHSKSAMSRSSRLNLAEVERNSYNQRSRTNPNSCEGSSERSNETDNNDSWQQPKHYHAISQTGGKRRDANVVSHSRNRPASAATHRRRHHAASGMTSSSRGAESGAARSHRSVDMNVLALGNHSDVGSNVGSNVGRNEKSNSRRRPVSAHPMKRQQRKNTLVQGDGKGAFHDNAVSVSRRAPRNRPASASVQRNHRSSRRSHGSGRGRGSEEFVGGKGGPAETGNGRSGTRKGSGRTERHQGRQRPQSAAAHRRRHRSDTRGGGTSMPHKDHNHPNHNHKTSTQEALSIVVSQWKPMNLKKKRHTTHV